MPPNCFIMPRIASRPAFCGGVMFVDFNTPDLTRAFVTYTTATPEMIAAAKAKCKEMGFKEILETHAGGTIASHCGANTLGILYYNDGKKRV